MIDKYGADALRYFLATATAPGMDLRYDEEKVASTWNFINKLWNASRFVLMNLDGFTKEDIVFDDLTISDKWILTKLEKTIQVVRKHMDKYEFHVVGSELYRFIWDDFCDWYIELTKGAMTNTTKSVLVKVLTSILKMLHPFMPYVTEEIYLMMPIHEESIMISSYPVYEESYIFEQESKQMEEMIDFITRVRTYKLEQKVPKDAKVYYKGLEKDLVFKLLKVQNTVDCLDENMKKQIIRSNYEHFQIAYSFDQSKNQQELKEKLEKELLQLTTSIERRKKLLSNQGYVSHAPESIVNKERENLQLEEKRKEEVEQKISDLK